MISKFGRAILFLLSLSIYAGAAPKIVQSAVINFPVNGRVIVQAQKQIGEPPQMVFISEKTNRILLRSSIKDKDSRLITDREETATSPDLRFRVIRSAAFKTPLIMSVGIVPGGSDDSFFLKVFGEIEGKLQPLNDEPLFTNGQGGYYLGFLNNKLGAGLAVWNFIWGHGPGEVHYSKHRYKIDIYQLEGARFERILRKDSEKIHDSGLGALREVGLRLTDQRKGIPKIKEFLE